MVLLQLQHVSVMQVTCVDFTADGALLASADHGGTVCTWDLAAAKQLASEKQHAGPVWSLAASHGRTSGTALASGVHSFPCACSVQPVRANLRTAGEIVSWHGCTCGQMHAMMRLPHQQSLCAGGADGTVRLWSLGGSSASSSGASTPAAGIAASLEAAQTLTTKATPVCKVTFTRRNLLLAAGSLLLPPGSAGPASRLA